MYGARGPGGEVSFEPEKGVVVENLGKLGESRILNGEVLDYYVEQYSRNGIHPTPPHKLGRGPGAARQEDHRPAHSLHPGDLRLGPQARDGKVHGRADSAPDPRRGRGDALGADAEARGGECCDPAVAGEGGAGESEERVVTRWQVLELSGLAMPDLAVRRRLSLTRGEPAAATTIGAEHPPDDYIAIARRSCDMYLDGGFAGALVDLEVADRHPCVPQTAFALTRLASAIAVAGAAVLALCQSRRRLRSPPRNSSDEQWLGIRLALGKVSLYRT
ncbi:hypothetical protein OPT61_g6593 [Boeremia exigua]|uniref:Uncharacterized protein n=1 Tax=Boeremia exigua TaxID=749465 RepID=A0ACC2I5H5_9PLEO|nr:hypothetical protein OPT61_g6593 [Boeremia exigua]